MASLTVGYSDSEDRVWVRLVEASTEQRAWLTRRQVASLITLLSNHLEISLVEVGPLLQMNRSGRLAMEQQEAVSLMAGATGPDPVHGSSEYSVIEAGLCSISEVQVVDMRWYVRLYTPNDKPLVFNGSRIQAHQLLKSLLNRQREAGWALAEPAWLGFDKPQ